MSVPVLYSFRRCPYAMRARMALLTSGIEVELREVELCDVPAEMTRISPKATVPVLQLENGDVIDESRDIIDWSVGQRDPLGWGNTRDDAQVAALIDSNDHDFKSHLDRYKYSDRHPEHSPDKYRGDAEAFLCDLESRLQQSRYLIADQCSAADIAIFPFIRQFSMVDSPWFAQSPYEKVRAWLDEFLRSYAFAQVMEKYSPWVPGSAPVRFPSELPDSGWINLAASS